MSHLTSGRAGPFSGVHSRRGAAMLLALCSLLILSGCTLVWAVPGGGGLTALVLGLVALGLAACTSSGGGGGGNGGDVTVINGHADEGDGNTSMTLTIVRSGGSGSLKVDWSTADGTAEAGTDYTSDSGSVNVGADGSAQITISVNATDDGAFNGARWFALELSAPTADSVTDGAGIIHEAEDVLQLDELTGSLGFAIIGEDPGGYLGRTVSGAGDFNGDGIDDIVIGAPEAFFQSGYYGLTYLLLGDDSGSGDIDLDGLAASQGMRMRGSSDGDEFGFSVRAAGDVDNDGLADVIVGAPNVYGAYDYSGAAYVIFGDASPPLNLDVRFLSTSEGITISGGVSNEYIASSVSGAGDFNGDGVDDVIVGGADVGSYGAAYIVFGKSNLSSLTLPPATASVGITVFSTGGNQELGEVVSGVGDFDGDGVDDVLVTDPAAMVGETSNVGEGYVLLGKTSGLADIDVDQLLAQEGFVVDGYNQGAYESGDEFGLFASGVGDTNGDGLADVVVGAGLTDADDDFDYGDAHLLFGTESPSNVSTLLSASHGIDFHDFPRAEVPDQSVGPAGDVNGDGIADIIFGNPDARVEVSGSYYDGIAMVVFGSTESQSDLDMPPTGSRGFSIEGIYEAQARVGWSVSGAGDINGDGFGDLLIGAPRADTVNGTDTGVVYVIFGPF